MNVHNVSVEIENLKYSNFFLKLIVNYFGSPYCNIIHNIPTLQIVTYKLSKCNDRMVPYVAIESIIMKDYELR